MLRLKATGASEIDAAFENLQAFGNEQLAAAVVRAGLRAIAKQMQRDIDPRVADVRADVGYRLLKTADGEPKRGKVGVGVGKRSKKYTNTKRARPGIGIDAGNWHWWVLGSYKSGIRYAYRRRGGGTIQGVKPQIRGVMRPQQPNFATNAATKARSAAVKAMHRTAMRQISKFSSTARR